MQKSAAGCYTDTTHTHSTLTAAATTATQQLGIKPDASDILGPPAYGQLRPLGMPRNLVDGPWVLVLEDKLAILRNSKSEHTAHGQHDERRETSDANAEKRPKRTLTCHTSILPSLDPVARYVPSPGEKAIE